MNRSGSLLLEVAVAIVVIGVTLAAALSAAATAATTTDRLRRQLIADALTNERYALIEQAVQRVGAVPDSLRGGRFTSPFEEYSWTAEVVAAVRESDLYSVAVRVEWDNHYHVLEGRVFAPGLGAR